MAWKVERRARRDEESGAGQSRGNAEQERREQDTSGAGAGRRKQGAHRPLLVRGRSEFTLQLYPGGPRKRNETANLLVRGLPSPKGRIIAWQATEAWQASASQAGHGTKTVTVRSRSGHGGACERGTPMDARSQYFGLVAQAGASKGRAAARASARSVKRRRRGAGRWRSSSCWSACGRPSMSHKELNHKESIRRCHT